MSIATQYASRAANKPAPPSEPMFAPTGFVKLDAMLEGVNTAIAGVEQGAMGMEDPEKGTLEKASGLLNAALGVVGAPFELLDTGFAMLTSGLAALMPGMPAAVLMAPHLGTPHTHPHPPSLVPPAPPVPLPSIGTVVGAGCVSVTIGGLPAARASDLGVAPTCVAVTPFFEVYTGSSNTFIGGARAARMSDITRSCGFTQKLEAGFGRRMAIAGVAAGALSAGASASQGDAMSAQMAAAQAAADAAVLAMSMAMGKDPIAPLNIPCAGALLAGHPLVLIGGFPMPDVLDLLGPLMALAKKGLGKMRKKRPKPDDVTPNHKGCGDPVDPVTGTVYRDYEDFVFDPKHNWSWKRHYKSIWANDPGPFGRGHRHELGQYLELSPRLARLHTMSGAEVLFPCTKLHFYEGVFQGYRLETQDSLHFILKPPGSEESYHFLRRSEHDRRAQLHAIVSPTRGELRLHYDARNRLYKLQADRSRVELRLHYDEHDRVVAIHRRAPNRTPHKVAGYRYDEHDCLVAVETAQGGVFSYRYEQGRITRMEKPGGYGFRWEYDHLGRCTGSEGDDRGWGVRFEYGYGETRVTESDGGTWTYLFNDLNQVTKIVDPLGGFVTYHINEDGRITGQSDATNLVATWLYDQDGRHYARIDPWGAMLPPEDIDPNPPTGRELHLPETNLEIQLGVADPLSLHEKAPSSLPIPDTLKPIARKVLLDALRPKQAEQVEYDDSGEWIRKRDPWGRQQTRLYSDCGELVEEHDPDGQFVAKEYGAWFVVKAQTDGNLYTTRYEHDHKDRITAIIDASGHRVEYPRDLCGRIERVINDGELEERYDHDLAGRVVATYDGDGNKLVEYRYADQGMCQERVLCTGEVHRYGYDAQGMITEASMDEVKVELAYDFRRKVRMDLRDGRGVEHRRIGLGGGYESVLFERFVTRYEVDGDATMIVTPEGSRHRIAWRDGGCVEREHVGGIRELSHYDSKGRCSGRMLWKEDGGEARGLWHVRFEHSPGGDLVRVRDSLRGTTEYGFDAAHRVVWMAQDGDREVRYRYDAGGNLVGNRRYGGMRCDARHQVLQADGERFGWNRRYDMEEWVRGGVRARFRYNGIDRLVGIDWDDGRPGWEAAYDGMGRRMWKVFGEERTEYFWEGPRLAAEVWACGRLRVYVYPGREGLVPVGFVDYEGVDAAPESGRWYSVHFDQVGMVSQVRDREGEVAWWAKVVDAFGEVVEEVDSAGIAWGLRWPGHFFDAETGLQYNRFRYYSAELGRYVRTDPLGQAGGVNVYAYPGCPLGVVDVFGLVVDE